MQDLFFLQNPVQSNLVQKKQKKTEFLKEPSELSEADYLKSKEDFYDLVKKTLVDLSLDQELTLLAKALQFRSVFAKIRNLKTPENTVPIALHPAEHYMYLFQPEREIMHEVFLEDLKQMLQL